MLLRVHRLCFKLMRLSVEDETISTYVLNMRSALNLLVVLDRSNIILVVWSTLVGPLSHTVIVSVVVVVVVVT